MMSPKCNPVLFGLFKKTIQIKDHSFLDGKSTWNSNRHLLRPYDETNSPKISAPSSPTTLHMMPPRNSFISTLKITRCTVLDKETQRRKRPRQRVKNEYSKNSLGGKPKIKTRNAKSVHRVVVGKLSSLIETFFSF